MALVDPAAHAYPAVHRPLQSVVFRPSVVALNHVPAGQLLHDPAPATLNVPGGHTDAVALVDPAAHAYPAVQSVQAPAPPTLYCPAGQSAAVPLADPGGHAYPALQLALQALVRAMPLLHVPAEQLVHAPAPAKLYFPAAHTDAVAVVDKAGQAYPAAQLLHAAAPDRLYWPAGQPEGVALVEAGSGHAYPAEHGLQDPAPTALYCPDGHKAAVELVEPAGHANPAVQLALQAAVRPVSLLQLPAAQSLHAPAPATLYLPGRQTDAVALVDPAGQEYPAVQVALQAAVRPVSSLHLPAAQLLQAPAPARLNFPERHTDTVALVEPAGHANPALQVALQAAVRLVSLLHLPAAQSLHAPAPARLYLPAGHTDAVALVDPAGQKYPAVQGPLQAGSVSEEALPHLPGPH